MTDLARLRAAGWSVAVHNDYRLNGEPHTFWLFTHPSGRWIKGEGGTDEEAIRSAVTNQVVNVPDYTTPPADAFDTAVAALSRMRYGAPSSWDGPNPNGWHLPEPCSPRDASMHDNGINDALMAVRRAQREAQDCEPPKAGIDRYGPIKMMRAYSATPWRARCPPDATALARALAMHDALPDEIRSSDDTPLRNCLPGVWPCVGDLRALLVATTELEAVIAAARCVRHWHDREPDGMVVSASHVRELWAALRRYDAALAQSATPDDYDIDEAVANERLPTEDGLW